MKYRLENGNYKIFSAHSGPITVTPEEIPQLRRLVDEIANRDYYRVLKIEIDAAGDRASEKTDRDMINLENELNSVS